MTGQTTLPRSRIDLILVEDSAADAELECDTLRDAGLTTDVRLVDDEATFRAALNERLPEAILADWTLPEFSGQRALEIACELCPDVPFIFVSGTISESTALEALRKGATDYVFKHQLPQLIPALMRALEEASMIRALRTSEEKFRQWFNCSRDALMILKPPMWSFSDANPATLQLFGASSIDDFIKLRPLDVSPEHQIDGRLSSEAAQEMIDIALRDGAHFFEWVHQRVNGQQFVAEVLLTRMEVGRGIILQATVRDITNRIKTEAELVKSERHYHAVTETANDAIITAAATGNVVDWNAGAEQMFGYTKAEILGQPLTVLMPERFHNLHKVGFERVLTGGVPHVIGKAVELAGLHRDGGEFPLELSLAKWRVEDGQFFTAIIRDITARKNTEIKLAEQLQSITTEHANLLESNKQLEQTQIQLLQAEKMSAIGVLASGIAHEINNPIGYVSSNLSTLEKYLVNIFDAIDMYEALEPQLDTDSHLLEKLHQFKEKVDLNYLRKDTQSLLAESHQGMERVKKIILDLKEFAHSDSKDEWVWADVHRGLDSTLNVVWNELKYKCEVIKEYGILPEIYCLPSQLNQVFMNLLINAAQAIEVRGTITLRSGQEGDMIWVEVNDTGNGISPENIPRLFDAFFTTKPIGEGTGLGLSVSHKIVEKHHGKIEIHSEVGKGATFRVWLPVQQAEIKEIT